MMNGRCGKLKIVFCNSIEVNKKEDENDFIILGKFISSEEICPSKVFEKIVDYFFILGKTPEFKENGVGENISADLYLKKIKKQKKWTRPVESNGLIFRFGHVPAKRQSFLSIEEKNAGASVLWAGWAKLFFGEKDFVQAWLSDVEYDYWQNAIDPLQYESAGRSYAGLPMKFNDLPPPLNRIEIDISSNPGRWNLQPGYVEAIGSVMWLGQEFWRNVGEYRLNKVFAEKWLNAQCLENNIIQICLAENYFFDDSSKLMQINLRKILYG